MAEINITSGEAFIEGIVTYISSQDLKCEPELYFDVKQADGKTLQINATKSAAEYLRENMNLNNRVQLKAKIQRAASSVTLSVTDICAVLDLSTKLRAFYANEPEDTRTIILSGHVEEYSWVTHELFVRDKTNQVYYIRNYASSDLCRGNFVKLRLTVCRCSEYSAVYMLKLADKADIIEHRSATGNETEKQHDFQ